MAGRNSDTRHPPPPYQQPNSSSSTQPRQNFGFLQTHGIGGPRTNAGIGSTSFGGNSQRRHSEQLPPGGGGGGGGGEGGRPWRPQSPGSNGSSSTNSSSQGSRPIVGKPPVAPLSSSSSQRNGRPHTGPVRAAHHVPVMRERSQSVESAEGSESSIDIGEGKKGRMQDVGGDAVLISTSPNEAGSSSSFIRLSLSSIARRDGVPSDNSTGFTVSSQEPHQPPVMRQRSGSPYNSGEMRSGEGVFDQPHSSHFPAGNSDQQSKAKALAGEKSIDFIQYRRALSKTSSSGSSYEQPPGTTNRTNSRDETLRELSEQRDDEVTEVMRRLSVVEEEKEKLRKEKEKLERKLKEAETVAEQAGTAATEVSRLEAELKKEKEDMMKLLRVRQMSPEADEGALSLKLSQELDIVKAKLEYEVSTRVAIEQEMNSLKQSLVVGGPGDTAVVRKLRERETELERRVGELQQALAEKEEEKKRQNHVQSRTIADLQSKLSQERQQREELRRSADSGPRSPATGSNSSDIAAMAERLREKDTALQKCAHEVVQKDATIQKYWQQLQQFEKTAREVAKITTHSKQQSQTVATLRQDLVQAQEALGKREAELKASQEELIGMRTHYDNSLRKKNAELSQKGQEVEQLRREVEDLGKQVTQLKEGETRASEVEQALQKSEKELNHWKQKSVQQDMVMQTRNQDLDRAHREVDGLKSTVSAQGKEVERLQRENETLRSEMETHKLTAMTYKEDFESERKDRESVHTRIADMETRYRHQLEALGEELQKVTDEAKRQRETVARKDNQLQQQRQQMTAQLHQKEGELASAAQRIQALEEEVMSKTQQVKQYKKQIDQLSSETAVYKQQAQVHKDQIEFYAKRTEEYGRQKTFREIHERKIVQLEAQCDKLRAENNELRSTVDVLKQLPTSTSAALQSRNPLLKSHTLGGQPMRSPDGMPPLPNRHLGSGHPAMRMPTDVGQNRAGHPANHQFPHPNHTTAPPPPNYKHVPYSNAGATVSRHGVMDGQPSHFTPAPQFQRQDSPYSSLPSSGLGYGPPPAGDMVDKDSPPNSNIGQPPPGPQRRAHSQMLSMASVGPAHQRYPPAPAHPRPPPQGYQQQQQPPNVYSNLPVPPAFHHMGASGGGTHGNQWRHPGGPPHAMRQPHTQDVAYTRRGGQQQPQLSTPTEETHRRRPQKPRLEGYVQPQQASPHPVAGQRLAVNTLTGGARETSSNRNRSTVSPSTSTGDISNEIDTVIEETASKVREEEQVVEGDDGEGIPFDPNLVCPKCRMRFREGEIQKFRRHVSSAHK